MESRETPELWKLMRMQGLSYFKMTIGCFKWVFWMDMQLANRITSCEGPWYGCLWWLVSYGEVGFDLRTFFFFNTQLPEWYPFLLGEKGACFRSTEDDCNWFLQLAWRYRSQQSYLLGPYWHEFLIYFEYLSAWSLILYMLL